MRRLDLTGRQFGRWKVVSMFKKRSPSGVSLVFWNCLCRCGNIGQIYSSSLINGDSTSCGCVRIDELKSRSTVVTKDWLKSQIKISDLGCWEWQGTLRRFGYGKVCFCGRSLSAHRVSWELFNGRIPNGLWVLHRCDNPPCCNPDHLFLGTRLDNMRDCASKGRARSKLSIAQVVEIRDLIHSGKLVLEIAESYGVSASTIYGIRQGRRRNNAPTGVAA